jgi:hypothetical protein
VVWPRGTVIDLLLQRKAGKTFLRTLELARLGMSADLAVHYARAGWLKWLARGVYLRPEQGLSLYPSLLLLERRIEGLHVGGKSVLAWYGVRHYVPQQETLHLYGWMAKLSLAGLPTGSDRPWVSRGSHGLLLLKP